MVSPYKSRGFLAAAALGICLALLLPAQAQFWDWSNRPQRQRDFNSFGGWFGGNQRWDRWEGGGRERDRGRGERDRGDRDRGTAVDYSHAPGPSQKKSDATTPIVVVGDANADWLAYGLEDAFSEKPEFSIVRKHRTDSGLIRYGERGDSEWPQVAREIVAAEKPKFIIMMIGNNDRRQIRETIPPAAVKPGAAKGNAQQQQPAAAAPATPLPPVDAEQQPSEHSEAAEQPAHMTPWQVRQASYGPWEFHTEKWELAYIKRVDATIAALKSAGVPVLWVGLPSQRGTKASADSSYLNEIYRSRAEKAGIVYVDIWDGFVDEVGQFSPQGPDYEGQIRRLRTNDGVYFTKFGARKLAHYVEREIDRSLANRSVPVALPVQGPQPALAKPGGGAGGGPQRPVAGPVVPLTATSVPAEELLGGSRAQPAPTTDGMATRVLTKGEPVSAPSGRADDFSWPRGGADKTDPAAVEQAPAKPAPATARAPSPAGQHASQVSPSGQSGAVLRRAHHQ